MSTNPQKKLQESLHQFYQGIKELNFRTTPEDYYYTSIEEFILKEGVSFSLTPLNAEEKIIVKTSLSRCGKEIKKKLCFHNSQCLMIYDDTNKIKYIEGFAFLRAYIPILHGWNTINGKVIDITFERYLKEGDTNFGKAYLGVEIKKKLIVDKIMKTGKSSVFIDNREEAYPVLKRKF